MPSKRPYGSKQLTEHLRNLAAEATEMTAEGDVLTRGEALALLLWRKALGYVERKVDDEGNETEVVHEPAAWAMQLVYDRLEGRTPQSPPEEEGRIKVADQVRDLARDRLNKLATRVAAGGETGKTDRPKPPSLKRKKADDAE